MSNRSPFDNKAKATPHGSGVFTQNPSWAPAPAPAPAPVAPVSSVNTSSAPPLPHPPYITPSAASATASRSNPRPSATPSGGGPSSSRTPSPTANRSNPSPLATPSSGGPSSSNIPSSRATTNPASPRSPPTTPYNTSGSSTTPLSSQRNGYGAGSSGNYGSFQSTNNSMPSSSRGQTGSRTQSDGGRPLGERPWRAIPGDDIVCGPRVGQLVLIVLLVFSLMGLFIYGFNAFWKENYAFMCSSPGRSDMFVYANYSFDPEIYTNLRLHLDEAVHGRVMVIEADTPGSRTVDMKLKIRAPIDKVREAIQPKSITHPDLGHGQLAEVWVDVSAMTQTIRDQVRKWKCARVDVEIVYPIKRKERKEPEGLSEGEGGEEGENGDKDEEGGDERNGRGGGRGDSETGLMGNVIQSTGSLIVQVHNSRVSVNLPNWVFRNKLSLSSTDKGGEIELLSAASTALTELKLEEGEISGRLATLHTVRAKVTDAEGRIQLDIDGNDKRIFSGSGLRPRMVANTTMTMTATARRNGTVMMAGGDPAIEAEPEEDPAQALDLAAMTAGGGPIQVQVFTPIAYQGRFNLMHEGERQFRRSSNDVPVVYTVKNRHQLTGYMAMGRKEPTLLLPNVDIQARGFRSGNVLLEFIHRSPPRSGGMRNGVPVQVYGLVVVAFIVQLLGAFL